MFDQQQLVQECATNGPLNIFLSLDDLTATFAFFLKI